MLVVGELSHYHLLLLILVADKKILLAVIKQKGTANLSWRLALLPNSRFEVLMAVRMSILVL